MTKFRNAAIIFCFGAIGYSIIEILWRGFTHWTMGVTGGVCFLLLYEINTKINFKRLWEKCLAGAIVITCMEFIVGIIVNKILHWGVWDYSSELGNVLGQICPFYSILWYLMCMPLCYLIDTIEKYLSGEKSLPFFRQISSK